MIVIEKPSDFLLNLMEEINQYSPPVLTDRCPHCSYNIKFPIVARKVDIDKFEFVMNNAFEVMKRHNITANLLAEIKAECFIQLAKHGKKTSS